jgi:hypothetical protein
MYDSEITGNEGCILGFMVGSVILVSFLGDYILIKHFYDCWFGSICRYVSSENIGDLFFLGGMGLFFMLIFSRAIIFTKKKGA